MQTSGQVSEAQRKLVKLGMIAKGVVYMLIGILAIMPLLGMGGSGNGGRKDVIHWLMSKPYGIILVALIAIGLLFYAIWRFIIAFKNSRNYSGAKGFVKRAGMAISGIFYGAFAFYAGNLVIKSLGGSGGNPGSGETKYQLIQDLLQTTWGKIILILIGLVLFGRSIYYIYLAYTGKYRERVRGYGVNEKHEDYLVKAGKLGFLARGIVFTVIAYFIIMAVVNHNPESATQSTGEALQFIQSTGGNLLLIVVALGLICYGIFMFIQAKYRNIESII